MKDMKDLMRKITVTIPCDYYNEIEKLKEVSKWSRSLIVREAIKDFLSRYGESK